MKDLIKEIRDALSLSQVEFGERIGVSFSTVNRWENGKAYPNKTAQLRMFDLVIHNQLDVVNMIHRKIQKQVEEIAIEEDRVLLYHGSKSGITGTIKPISRKKCDFGSGFYMGTVIEQPLTLICDFEDAILYVVSAKISDKKILEIAPDLDWALLVAFHRQKMECIKGSLLYEKYAGLCDGYDFVVGSIADDRMFFVLDQFFQGNITDKALVESMAALKLGKQYVAIADRACSDLRIEKEMKLSYLEKLCLSKKANDNRIQGIFLANEVCKRYRREGLFFDEIMNGV